MFTCNCCPPFGYAVLTQLGLSHLRPSTLHFKVVPGFLQADCGVQANLKRMRYEESFSTHSSVDFKSKRQFNIIKPTRILFQKNQSIMDELMPLNLISESSTIIQLNNSVPTEYKKLPAIRFGLEALLTFAFRPELSQILPTTPNDFKLKFLHIQHFVLTKINSYEELKLACINLVHVTAAVFRDDIFINMIFRDWLYELQKIGEGTLSSFDLDKVIDHVMITLCNVSACLRDEVLQSAEPDEVMVILHENLIFDLAKLSSTSQNARWELLYQTVESQNKLITELNANTKSKANNGNNHFTRHNPTFEQNIKPTTSVTSKSSKPTGWCIYAMAHHFFPSKNNPCGKSTCNYRHDIPVGSLSDEVVKSMLKSASTLDKNPVLRDSLISTLTTYGRK